MEQITMMTNASVEQMIAATTAPPSPTSMGLRATREGVTDQPLSHSARARSIQLTTR